MDKKEWWEAQKINLYFDRYLNEEERHLEAHLDCAEDIKMSDFNTILQKIEQVLYDIFQINHVNIQPEYKKEEDSKEFIVQD